jgi:hypothetical protein
VPNTQRLLELALKGLDAERAKLDDEIRTIKAQLGQGKSTTAQKAAPKRRRMSAAARKRISEGMKRRYAEMRKAMRKAV